MGLKSVPYKYALKSTETRQRLKTPFKKKANVFIVLETNTFGAE